MFDRRALKRPLTAYFLFSAEQRAKISGKSITESAKKVNQRHIDVHAVSVFVSKANVYNKIE